MMESFNSSSSEFSVNILDILTDVIMCLSKTKYANCFTIRGAFALMTYVSEEGRKDLLRKTTDIDLDFISIDMWEKFVKDLIEILNMYSTLDGSYELIKRRGREININSDSLSLKFKNTTIEMVFKIDMNIKDFEQVSKLRLYYLNVNAASVYDMLCDKLAVLSQKKVCRRVKDLYDVYVISLTFNIDLLEFTKVWYSNTSRSLDLPIFILNFENIELIHHAYSKYVGITNKPNFSTLLERVILFLAPIYDRIVYDRITYNNKFLDRCIWSSDTGVWKN